MQRTEKEMRRYIYINFGYNSNSWMEGGRYKGRSLLRVIRYNNIIVKFLDKSWFAYFEQESHLRIRIL